MSVCRCFVFRAHSFQKVYTREDVGPGRKTMLLNDVRAD